MVETKVHPVRELIYDDLHLLPGHYVSSDLELPVFGTDIDNEVIVTTKKTIALLCIEEDLNSLSEGTIIFQFCLLDPIKGKFFPETGILNVNFRTKYFTIGIENFHKSGVIKTSCTSEGVRYMEVDEYKGYHCVELNSVAFGAERIILGMKSISANQSFDVQFKRIDSSQYDQLIKYNPITD